MIAFIILLLIQKYCIQEIIFLKKVCLGVDFPSQVSSSRERDKGKCRVTYQWTNYANKNYANFSLHNRRSMSQASRMWHFARSARRGEEKKNKAPVASPLSGVCKRRKRTADADSGCRMADGGK